MERSEQRGKQPDSGFSGILLAFVGGWGRTPGKYLAFSSRPPLGVLSLHSLKNTVTL